MPHKKNKRKQIQAAKADEQTKQKRVGMIAHTPYRGSGATLAIAAAMAFPSLVSVDVLGVEKESDQ